MTKPGIEDILALAPLQQGMLYHSLREPEAGYYFEQVTFTFPASIDVKVFQRAWNQAVSRHQALRTGFAWEKLESPAQIVFTKAEMPIETLDWIRKSEAEQAAAFREFLLEDRARGMDLRKPPLMRITLIRLKRRMFQIVASFHHGILDGWSLNLLFREFSEIYQAFEVGRMPELAPAPRYSDFIAWLQDQDPSAAESYWSQYLDGFAGRAPLPMDRAAVLGTGASLGVDHVVMSLPKDLSSKLATLARGFKVTLNVVLQAAWAVLLARHTNSSDICFGTIVSGRPAGLPSVEDIVGLFINTVPQRVTVRPDVDLGDLVASMQKAQLAQRDVDHCALSEIQAWSPIPPGEPLFDTLFIFENLPGTGKANSGSAFAFERTNYPLTLLIAPGQTIGLKAIFEIPRLAEPEVRQLLLQYQALLADMAAGTMRIGDLSAVTPEERDAVLSAGPESAPVGRLEEIWTERVHRETNAVAVIDGSTSYTVANLDQRSDAIAGALSGVEPGDVVAIALDPSLDLIASMLGCMKIGAPFLLLNQDYPVERLHQMIEGASVRTILTDQIDVFSGTTAQVFRIGDFPSKGRRIIKAHGVGPADIAHVVFTSGSTGKPKAVALSHGATLNRLNWMWQRYPFTNKDVCCQKTSVGFVDLIAEILGPVLGGAPLVILDREERRDPIRMVDALRNHGVTRLIAVPSLLKVLLDLHPPLAETAPDLSLIVSSGEDLPTDLAARLRAEVPNARLLNLYGSSEVAADATFEEVGDCSDGFPVPIGRPIDNLQVYVLDETLDLAPTGAAGQIFVAGAGLALGYLVASAQTAERFLPNPFSDGGRMYRTGDRGRRLPDGRIEFLGRTDNQINLRGIRVEAGEVEAALQVQRGVQTAIVYADASERLAAVVVPKGKAALQPPALRSALERKLPNYMVPESIRIVDSLPLLPNGKIDRSSVSKSTTIPVKSHREPPATPTEKVVAQIWAELLRHEHVGRDDNFFTLGGHSILSMQMASRVLKQLNRRLPLAVVFERPTLRDVSSWLDDNASGTKASAGPQLVRRDRRAQQVDLEERGV